MSNQAIVPDLSTITDGPDIAGFQDAQERIRLALGQNVDFQIPIAPVYPDGTQLDPETGEPYDPTVDPTSGGGNTIVTKKVVVCYAPIQGSKVPNEKGREGWQGVARGESCALLASVDDFPDIEPATGFVLNEVEYQITEIIEDGLVGMERAVVFGEAR